jgi:predicted ATP-grasp superfamily ATP-dependent carboligase
LSATAEKSTPETTSVDTTAIERPWLIQEYVPGVPCSVGLIGRRGAGPATILPPAIQNLRLQNGHPVYCGGRMPCDLDLQNAILPLAEKLAYAVGEFSGYLGVDIVVSRVSSGKLAATVIELNPRLCTSYVGYRRATDSNLAGLILREPAETEIHWRAAGIEFEACGKVDSSS